MTKHRSDTIQRIRLGTDETGRILAIGHDAYSGNLRSEGQFEAAADHTRTLYAGANRLKRNRLVPLDAPVASSMRAFGEAVGLLALECAMDELACWLGVDPIDLWLRRMLGVFTAGRILNEQTARSHAIGGMIFGVGAALEEQLVLDPRFGG